MARRSKRKSAGKSSQKSPKSSQEETDDSLIEEVDSQEADDNAGETEAKEESTGQEATEEKKEETGDVEIAKEAPDVDANAPENVVTETPPEGEISQSTDAVVVPQDEEPKEEESTTDSTNPVEDNNKEDSTEEASNENVEIDDKVVPGPEQSDDAMEIEAAENEPDENKPDENKPDENKPDENKPDENKPDESKADENKSDAAEPEGKEAEASEENKDDGFEVVDEIDLTKSDDDDTGMELGEEDEIEVKREYIVPDYDDPDLVDLEIDPEQDGNAKIKESKDFLKYWRAVVDNPQEFTSWTYLLQFVEQEGKLPLARRAYNSFFCRYPLCYGYWKKFSELERKSGDVLRAQKILERGVRAIPLSIDLWIHVIDFYINHYDRPDAGIDKIRKIYDRAITAAGEEFRSEKLWNKYIKWETENKNWLGVMAIYDKALRTQTQHYSIIFNDFKTFVNKHSPSELLLNDQFQLLLAETRAELSAEAAKKAEEKNEEKKDTDCEVVEDKDEEMDEAPPGVDDHEKPPSEEEVKAVRLRIIKDNKKIYEETEQLVTKIWAFEEGVKRPYFHVKQLERAQLKNWREYLDMEIGREDHRRTVLLFERCLIACALYEDFWLKYAKYMTKFDNEKAGKIFQRACNTHLPKKPNIHMQWSAHEELQGNTENAAKILEHLDNTLPGMAMIKMRRVAVERRAGNIQAAEDLIRSCVASAAKDKEEIFYTRKLAWFLLKISNKKDEAKKLLKDLIPKYKSEVKLYNDLVEMEFQCAGVEFPTSDEEEALAVESFDIALNSDKLSDDQKFNFSQRKLEYFEDFGCDVKRLQKVYDDHQKLVRSHKKRSHIDLTGDDTPAKKAKTETAPISVVGTPTQMSNGARYSNSTTASTYANQQATYGTGDQSMYYQQQQNYWNYQNQKPNDPQQQYNYGQWSQYYGQQ